MLPRRVAELDWSTWVARDLASLVFVVQGSRLLLIRKKRGLGAGKLNGPGGRLEPGEAPEACAVREVEEELRITPRELEKLGELQFQFVDGYSTHVHVYRAPKFDGTPTETDEALPIWVDAARVPYDEMWEDDRLWLPLLLGGVRFHGRFVFEGDRMLDHELAVG
jgi:8-oxo-dGTP diphosphatase